MEDKKDEEVQFTKNKRLIENKDISHVGGPMIRRSRSFTDSPQLNKYGMTEFE